MHTCGCYHDKPTRVPMGPGGQTQACGSYRGKTTHVHANGTGGGGDPRITIKRTLEAAETQREAARSNKKQQGTVYNRLATMAAIGMN